MSTIVSMRRIARLAAGGALGGIVIGVTLELVVSWLTSNTYIPGTPLFLSQFSNVHQGVLAERVIYAALGAVCSCADVVWKRQNGSILANTCLHYVLVGVPLCIVAYVLYWIPRNVYAGLAFLLVVTLVYAMIWLIQYAAVRHQIKRVNQRVNQGMARHEGLSDGSL